ncbi:p48 polypeptide of DNA primase [Coemansia sp. RSA 1290]|nr:p48 polypeptide of DNA primase [Coemansia sp. RSA 1290]
MMTEDGRAMEIDEVTATGSEEISTETLGQYYQRLFPFSPYFAWLNHTTSPSTLFTHREFSFTINDGIYLRYQSFKTLDELQREVQRLAPSKIDIGAVFTAQPRNAKSLQPGAFKPVSKELVFDVDLTDYDDIRTCCQGGNICKLCWRFMVVAMHVVDRALREDFGFQNLLWVYSGRRGVHCWVSDKRARELDDAGRKAVAGYLSLIRGGAEQARKVALSQRQALHPHIKRSLDIIEEYFEDILLVDQEILLTRDRWLKVLAAIPDEDIRKTLDTKWSKHPDRPSVEKWSELVDVIDKHASKPRAKLWLGLFERSMMLQLAYPRLDENVSVHANHLLKSPFCVHPKTGRICTPIANDAFDSFDPLAVPMLNQLLSELNSASSDATSLAPYVATFDSFAKSLQAAAAQDSESSQKISLEF